MPTTSAAANTGPVGNSRVNTRAIVAATVGNAFEFYDFLAYAAFAGVIGRAFFPSSSSSTSLLLSVATFGVGFVARPLGSVIIGAFADRYGRRPAMTMTMALMALGSGLIGILPTFDRIGVAAPLLLVVARLIQGFSAGGEMGSATSLLVESAPPNRVAFFGSLQLSSQNMGFLAAAALGAALTATLPTADMENWGWRVPFLLGVLIAPVGLYIRLQLRETLAAGNAHVTMTGVLAELFRGHSPKMLLAVLVISGGTISQYFFGYVTTYALTVMRYSATVSMLSGVAVGIAGAVFAVIGGLMADRLGVKRVTILARIVLTLLFYPALLLTVANVSPALFILVMSALAAIHAVSGAAGIVLLALAFPARIRTAGLSISYAAGVAVFGGSAQVVFTWLIQSTGDRMAPIWFVVTMNLISAAAALALGIPVSDSKGCRAAADVPGRKRSGGFGTTSGSF